MSLFEKYRPKSLDEVIGQDKAVEILRNVKEGLNLLLYGSAGSGKTSSAYAWAYENGYENVNEFNASMDRGINIIRHKIKQLAFTKIKRVILLDEADMMTSEAQNSLRRIMEMKYPKVSFILTANYPYKIIDPIKSRCVNVPFKRLSDKNLAKILLRILKGEKVKITDKEETIKTLRNLATAVNGDARMGINYLEPLIEDGVFKPAKLFQKVPSFIAQEVIKTALNGDIRTALVKLEDALVEQSLLEDKIFRDFYIGISNLDDEYGLLKPLLYNGLAEAERGVKYGGNIFIQLAGFLGKIQLYRILNFEKQNNLVVPSIVEKKESGEIEF